MSSPIPTESVPSVSKSPVARTMVLGVLIGTPCWVATGMLCGMFVVLIAWVVAYVKTNTGYLPYKGTATNDALALGQWFALGFLPLGLVGSTVMGTALGRTSSPGFWSILRYCGSGVGMGITSLGQRVGMIRRDEELDHVMRSVAFCMGWGTLFLILMGVMSGMSFHAAYKELSFPVLEGTVISVRTRERPITYFLEVNRNGFLEQTSIQESGGVVRVQEGDKVQVYSRRDESGTQQGLRLLLPGETKVGSAWTGKAMLLVGFGVVGVVLFGGFATLFFGMAVRGK